MTTPGPGARAPLVGGAFTTPSRHTPLTPLDLNAWRLSVLIPVYNEASTIDTVLDRVHATPLPKEVVCVDDCSTDGTRERLQELYLI